MRAVLVIVLGVLATLLVVGPAAAQEDPDAIQGTLRDSEGEPLAGVEITVSQDGSEIGTATSDDAGEWVVEVPEPGDYTVTLDTGTLPEGMEVRGEDGETLEGVTVRAGRPRTVIFQFGERAGGGGGQIFALFAQLTVEGLLFGFIIAMTAIGLSLIFGTTGLVNFAHAELVTLGAVFAYLFNVSNVGPTMQLIPAGMLAVGVGGLLGGGIEVGLWRPLRRRGVGLIQMLVVSIGLSLLLRHVILVLYGGRPNSYADYGLQQVSRFGPVSITPRDFIVMVLSVVVLLAVGLLLLRTRIGKAMRAVADNRDLAESSGIDVQRVILFVWVLGGGLAALGGVFFGLVETVTWDMGWNLLLLMFAGVILGGLGTAFGAVVGSLIVGLIAQVSTIWFPVELQYAWALGVLIIVLLFRPQGILGRAERIG